MVALAQVVGIPLSAYPFGRDSLPIRGLCVRPVGIGCRHRLSVYPWSDLVGIGAPSNDDDTMTTP
jgi:hypothetical protein